jgi:hypothetical protein
MNLLRFRSARSGQYTRPEDAALTPAEHVAERVDPPFTSEHLNALTHCANKHGIRETIRRLRT